MYDLASQYLVIVISVRVSDSQIWKCSNLQRSGVALPFAHININYRRSLESTPLPPATRREYMKSAAGRAHSLFLLLTTERTVRVRVFCSRYFDF